MEIAMIAIGIMSIFLCLGMVVRSKVKFFQRILVPGGVIGGILGFLFMNFAPEVLHGGTDVKVYADIVNIVFVLSFISIGLSGGSEKKNKKDEKDKGKGKKKKGAISGGIAMGLVWSILFASTALIGVAVIAVFGKSVGMDSMYGILIPMGFCQGPGQASTFGRIFESTYGYANAEMVALTFAVVGFLMAFMIGVPIAKYGLNKGLAKNKSKISKAVERGYFNREEQRESLGKVTTYSGNVETLATHMALMGVCYIIALLLSELGAHIPILGESMSGMLFFWGMIAGNIVKNVLRKLNVDFLINTSLQGHITGWASDYLVVGAFMAVKLSVIGSWLIPILIEGFIIAIITFLVAYFFGSRLGSDHDFERVMGIYGTCTGTTASGISLLRMIDPKLESGTTSELGIMNVAMLFSIPSTLAITLIGQGDISMMTGCIIVGICNIVYLVLLKVLGGVGKQSFSLTEGKRITEGGVSEEIPFVQGFLADGSGVIQ